MMSIDQLIRHAEYFVARRLPARGAAALRRTIARLPLKLTQSGPVIQAYVDDGATRCWLGIHNFYSVLLPDVVTDARAALVFRAASGEVVLEHEVDVPHAGSATIDVARLFAGRGVRSPLGIVSVQLTPRHPRRASYRALGLVTSHFFVHFESAAGAVGQTHALSTIDLANRAAGPFRSSQVVTTRGLRALELIQYNATQASHRLTHTLVDADTGTPYATQATTIAPLGATIARFELDAPPPRLGIFIDDLPSANAKPVIRRVYANGLYSVSHA